MKILHISTSCPLSFHGGITNYVRNLADKQNESGNEVFVLGGIDSEKNNYKFKYIEYSSNIQPSSLKYSRDNNAINRIKLLLDREKFDIIHIHMMIDIDFDLYELIKDKNYIISLHDYFYLCPRISMIDKNKKLCTKFDKNRCCKCIGFLDQNYFIFRVFRKLNLKLPTINSDTAYQRFLSSKKLLEGARYLLPVSNRVKEIYSDSGIKGNYKVMHIGNITAEKFNKNNKMVSKDKKIKIGIIGTLNYMKGAELISEIIENVHRNDLEFHFYGRIDKKYIKELNKQGLILHGSYKQYELAAIFKDIDIGLNVPVWEDNGPQVVMEMLNNNIPVIATKMGGITDFVTFENGYIFDPYNSMEVLNAITYINNLDYEEINRLKSNIRPTKTPFEHSNEMMKLYNTMV